MAKYQTAALAILRTFKDDMVSTGLAKCSYRFLPSLVGGEEGELIRKGKVDCTDFHFGSVLYAAVSLLKVCCLCLWVRVRLEFG